MLRRVLEKNKVGKYGSTKHDEYQYLHLINDILNEGKMELGRNGYAKTIIGSAMHFSLENNTLPLLTTKKVAIVPGIAFGADNHARLSFAASLEKIEEGIKRIQEAVELLQ